jgi:hypothetical protein
MRIGQQQIDEQANISKTIMTSKLISIDDSVCNAKWHRPCEHSSLLVEELRLLIVCVWQSFKSFTIIWWAGSCFERVPTVPWRVLVVSFHYSFAMAKIRRRICRLGIVAVVVVVVVAHRTAIDPSDNIVSYHPLS